MVCRDMGLKRSELFACSALGDVGTRGEMTGFGDRVGLEVIYA